MAKKRKLYDEESLFNSLKIKQFEAKENFKSDSYFWTSLDIALKDWISIILYQKVLNKQQRYIRQSDLWNFGNLFFEQFFNQKELDKIAKEGTLSKENKDDRQKFISFK